MGMADAGDGGDFSRVLGEDHGVRHLGRMPGFVAAMIGSYGFARRGAVTQQVFELPEGFGEAFLT